MTRLRARLSAVIVLALVLAAARDASASGSTVDEPRLTPDQRAALAAVKTLRVRVEQAYRVKDGEAITGVFLPVEQPLTTMLKPAGLKAAAPEAPAGDGTLTLRLEGVTKPWRAVGDRTFYSSADVGGEVRLEAAGVTVAARFAGYDGPTGQMLSTRHREPKDAPFQAALKASKYIAALAKVLEAVSGVHRSELLAPVLDDQVFDLSALDALRESPGPRTFEVLAATVRKRIGHRVDTARGAIDQLATLDDPRRTAVLLEVVTMKPAGGPTRAHAAKALGRTRAAEAAVPLAQVLGERYLDYSLQRETLAALHAIGDRRAIGPLITVLKDVLARPLSFDKTVAGLEKSFIDDVVKLMHALSGQSFGRDIQQWTGWWAQNQP